jgi:hypothetical protein
VALSPLRDPTNHRSRNAKRKASRSCSPTRSKRCRLRMIDTDGVLWQLSCSLSTIRGMPPRMQVRGRVLGGRRGEGAERLGPSSPRSGPLKHRNKVQRCGGVACRSQDPGTKPFPSVMKILHRCSPWACQIRSNGRTVHEEAISITSLSFQTSSGSGSVIFTGIAVTPAMRICFPEFTEV